MRTASSRLTGTTKRVAWWWAGANMKPKPASSMHFATPSGPRSMRAPSASEQIGRARGAGGRAVAVLGHGAACARGDKRRRGGDVERAPPPAGTGGVEQVIALDRHVPASSRIVRASPASSSTVSPLVRRAIRNAAIWVSETSPCMISASTSEASRELRSRREASASIARVRTALGISPQLCSRARAAPRHHSRSGQAHLWRDGRPARESSEAGACPHP